MSDDAREAVLGRVRRALGRDGPLTGEALAAVEHRLAEPRPNLIPARSRLDPEGRIKLFTDQAEAVTTEVRRLSRYADLPEALAEYLRAHNLPARVAMAPDPLLDRAGWGATDGGRAPLEIRRGTATADDEVGVTTAFAGVAETGTVMLVSGLDNPAMLAFLPETCVVVLPAKRVVGAYEEGWRRLREAHGAPPRAVTFVTGPSRTADIEQTLQLGAHGPRRLLVLIVDEDAGEGGRRPVA